MRLLDLAGGLAPGVAVYTGNGLGALTGVGQRGHVRLVPRCRGDPVPHRRGRKWRLDGHVNLEHVLGECNGLDATIMGRGPIAGSAGDDVIVGATGADDISGGDGNDTTWPQRR